MSELLNNDEERIKPAFLTDNNTGVKYELDFCRESVMWAESKGFDLEKVAKFPVTGIEELFYYSFRKNHRNVPREKTNKLLHEGGGLPEMALERLILLYQQAQTSNNIQTAEEAEKNGRQTWEM